MMRNVAERGKYFYSYSESRFTKLLNTFCSCCLKNKAWFKRRIERLERHEEASEKLAAEVDVVKFIYILRTGKFISKLMLNKH